MLPTHSCKIFTYLGLTCLSHCLTIFPSWLVVNFGPVKAHCFSRDFDIAQATVLEGVSPGRASSGAKAWSK
jgi:hypothetical protein